MTDTHEIIYPLGQRGEKAYPVQWHIPVMYRLYKGVPTRVRNQPKRFSEAGSVKLSIVEVRARSPKTTAKPI